MRLKCTNCFIQNNLAPVLYCIENFQFLHSPNKCYCFDACSMFESFWFVFTLSTTKYHLKARICPECIFFNADNKFGIKHVGKSWTRNKNVQNVHKPPYNTEGETFNFWISVLPCREHWNWSSSYFCNEGSLPSKHLILITRHFPSSFLPYEA